ncbi:MAG: GTPase ObgE, partial [Patescibacteria group bacterium]
SFRREKYVSAGNPDGGDGGRGGDLLLIADTNVNTLQHFVGPKLFQAGDWLDGHRSNRGGADGEDVILKVPVGTQVLDAKSGDLLVDMKQIGQLFVAARGGKGGFGNGHFVTSTRQAPHFAELGDQGELREVRLELKLVADVGLVGFPSAGKSTLISRVSAAKPKIAAYPFTTLVPNLGVVQLSEFGGSNEETFVMADIPGIIEGASKGKGLGDKFLKHISRTATLVFLIDPFAYDGKSVEEQYTILQKELKGQEGDLLKKTAFVVLSKIDALSEEDREKIKKGFLKKFPKLKKTFRMISAVSGEGLKEFALELFKEVQARKAESISEILEEKESDETPVYMPIKLIDDHSFKLKLEGEVNLENLREPIHNQLISISDLRKRKLFVISGRRIEQISRMTNVHQDDGVDRVYDVLKKMGIYKELRRAGAKNGDLFKIGPHLFEYHQDMQ